MESNWVVPQPQDLKLDAALEMLYLKQITDVVLTKVQFCQVLAIPEVFQTCDLVEGQRTYLEIGHVLNEGHLL